MAPWFALKGRLWWVVLWRVRLPADRWHGRHLLGPLFFLFTFHYGWICRFKQKYLYLGYLFLSTVSLGKMLRNLFWDIGFFHPPPLNIYLYINISRIQILSLSIEFRFLFWDSRGFLPLAGWFCLAAWLSAPLARWQDPAPPKSSFASLRVGDETGRGFAPMLVSFSEAGWDAWGMLGGCLGEAWGMLGGCLAPGLDWLNSHCEFE